MGFSGPGCGKSVLARTLTDENLLFTVNPAVPAIAYFFFKDGLNDQQGLARCISSLLHQIISQYPLLIKHALPDYRRFRTKLAGSFFTLWDILLAVGTDPDAGDVVCVVDSLDECEQSAKFTLLENLQALYSEARGGGASRLKFLITSRPYENIERRLRGLISQFPEIHLQGERESKAISHEISLVIAARVPKLALESRLSSELEDELLHRIRHVLSQTHRFGG